MKSLVMATCLGAMILPACGQTKAVEPSKKAALEGRDYIESTSYNEAQRGARRTMQYYPTTDGFTCINGRNRYTRPLYGSHTAYRLETSDRPVFAAYQKSESHNIAFRLTYRNKSIALDSTGYCVSSYNGGKRQYTLTDKQWDNGILEVTALALYDREGAIWHFKTNAELSDAQLTGIIAPIRARKLNRSGDMGADPADSFEASLTEKGMTYGIRLDKGEAYVVYEGGKLQQLSPSKGRSLYQRTLNARDELLSAFRIDTPDPYINTLGSALCAAADGIWDGQVWLHGANGWRMPLNGWRAAYTGDCMGWFDRARTHFDHYAASQVTGVEPVYPHPNQDAGMNMARAEKKWGTQMYSNGYICRNPNRNDQMHHYDMNLCYIDELLWHLCWTGDLDYARKMWPVITRHLAWEKRNFDPDNDGLYDAYCCIWASDALYYNSGAVTHSSAYNYRANKLAAEIAGKIGEAPALYAQEAERIKQALQQRLWMPDKDCWAEFQDFMGNKELHASPAVWTVYHAIDSEVGNPFEYYRATRYIDRNIPRIPVKGDSVKGDGLKDEGYYTLSTTDWVPYSWSINNVAFAEVWHTALAYWQAGRPDEAFHLFKSSVLDGMYFGHCPGNFGQVSFYDAARGECYRDFGDPIGVASRVLTQGLFGIYPDLLNGKVRLRPGFPKEWDHASFHASYIDFSYERKGDAETYRISPRFRRQADVSLDIPARKTACASVTVNGRPVQPVVVEESIGMPRLAIQCGGEESMAIEIRWAGEDIAAGKASACEGKVCGEPAGRTWFVLLQQGDMRWWQPVDVDRPAANVPFYGTELPAQGSGECLPVNMDSVWNANVTDIFKNRYESPRSPYTTLQIPLQGIGDWCHPKETAGIDDSGLRRLAEGNRFVTPQGIPFRTPKTGHNIAYTSLWDNYPAKVSIPLQGQDAAGAYLLMAGSTNHMQCHQTNGVVTVCYADGSSDTLSLVNPENWAPIEQDFYFDGLAFRSNAPRPYRVVFSSGLVSNRLEEDLKLDSFNNRRIPGGAAIILYLPLQGKPLQSLSVEAKANDVVIGLMAATLELRTK